MEIAPEKPVAPQDTAGETPKVPLAPQGAEGVGSSCPDQTPASPAAPGVYRTDPYKLTPAELAALESKLLKAPVKGPVPSLIRDEFETWFERWVAEFKVEPGVHQSIPAEYLARHFTEWLGKKGIQGAPLGHQSWGRSLGDLGLSRIVVGRSGRSFCPYLMASAPAKYFRDWYLGKDARGELDPPTWNFTHQKPRSSAPQLKKRRRRGG